MSNNSFLKYAVKLAGKHRLTKKEYCLLIMCILSWTAKEPFDDFSFVPLVKTLRSDLHLLGH